MRTAPLRSLVSPRFFSSTFIIMLFTLALFNSPLFSADGSNTLDEDEYVDQDVYWEGSYSDDDRELYPDNSKQSKYRKNAANPSGEGEAAPLANIEGEPSAFVHGCVNVITDQYCEFATDLIVYHGTDPIRYERSFAGCWERKRT